MYQQQMNQQGMRQNQQDPQNFQTQQNSQNRQNQHCQLTDQDLVNTVLAEMRRISGEYTTAILEASNPSIRENFYSLLDRTLQDQELVYTMMENMNMYGERSVASQKEIQKEEQQHRQRASELQLFLLQNLGQGNSPSLNNRPNLYQTYEQMQQFQPSPYNQHNSWDAQNQQYRQNQQNQQYQQNQQNQQFQQDQQNHVFPPKQMNEPVQTNQNFIEQQETKSNKETAQTQKETAQPKEKTPSEFSTPATDMYQSAVNKTDFNTTGSRQANSHTTGAESTQPTTKKPKASK